MRFTCTHLLVHAQILQHGLDGHALLGDRHVRLVVKIIDTVNKKEYDVCRYRIYVHTLERYRNTLLDVPLDGRYKYVCNIYVHQFLNSKSKKIKTS